MDIPCLKLIGYGGQLQDGTGFSKGPMHSYFSST